MLTTSLVRPPNDVCNVSFFADVFLDSPVPSIIIAADGTVLFWNAAAERLFGWSSEEVLGRPLPIVPPHLMDEHRWIRRHTLDGQGFWQHRITRVAKDGRRIELGLSTWPIRGTDGGVIGIIGIYANIAAKELRVR